MRVPRLTIHDICAEFNMSARQVRRYVKAGIIPPPKLGLDAYYDATSITKIRDFRRKMAEGTARLNRQTRSD